MSDVIGRVVDEDMELSCIKVWPSDELGEADPEVVAAFHQELGIMWRFRETPNFCQLYAYSECTSFYNLYDIMELNHLIYRAHDGHHHEVL